MSAAENRLKAFALLRMLAQDPGLSGVDYAVAITILDHFYGKPTAAIGYQRIADMTNRNLRTVKKSVARLLACTYFVKLKRNGRNGVSAYGMGWTPEPVRRRSGRLAPSVEVAVGSTSTNFVEVAKNTDGSRRLALRNTTESLLGAPKPRRQEVAGGYRGTFGDADMPDSIPDPGAPFPAAGGSWRGLW